MGEEGGSWVEEGPGVGAAPSGGLQVRGAEKMMPEWEEAEEGGWGSSLAGLLGWPGVWSWPWPRSGGGGGSVVLGSPSELDLTSSCQKTQQE